ncbi:C40 family peptidase [Luteimonas sp. SX5]|uniref:C40 family peptidase n=1 Tax=Luteimonas galliterrae TaxID=2940486 RepID=A0ABT0MH43_9GAMM|nr:C40 family peptidase [Luteimonas galliterrae]MCL1634190.1 C40 family peptidase [Luteimonas galliterrae]
MLCAASLPVLANQATLDNNGSLTNANTASPAMADAMALSDRALLEATVDLRAVAYEGAAMAPNTSAVPASGRMQALLQKALALLGTPYRWGGTSPDGGFDCSGMVGYVFRSALGIELPRVSREMAKDGMKVDRSALAVGDLVFFSRRGKRVDHVGIYVGDGRFVHAPRTGRDVTVSSLTEGYWSRKFMQARRVAEI